MLQQRDQREMKTIGKATETAKEAYEGLPIKQWTKEPPKITNVTSTDITFGGA